MIISRRCRAFTCKKTQGTAAVTAVIITMKLNCRSSCSPLLRYSTLDTSPISRGVVRDKHLAILPVACNKKSRIFRWTTRRKTAKRECTLTWMERVVIISFAVSYCVRERARADDCAVLIEEVHLCVIISLPKGSHNNWFAFMVD